MNSPDAVIGCYRSNDLFLDVYEKNEKIYYRVSFDSEKLVEMADLDFFDKKNDIFQKVRFADKTFSRFYYVVQEVDSHEFFAGLDQIDLEK